jgi:predicted TIM-barrel fold metal-dependent hydrolase
MKVTRREFIQRVSASTVAVGTLATESAFAVKEREEGLPIVDTHQHLWDLTKLRPPWLKPGTKLHRSFVMKDYLEVTRGLNVVKAVYMEVAVAPEDKLAEAEYIVDLCRRTDNPTVAAVIGGEPAKDGFREYITRFKDSPYVKGVRHIPPAVKGDDFLYLQNRFLAGVQLLGELGMSFDLCMPPQRFSEAIGVVDRCPDTRFILDHCGNADPKAFWNEARRAENPTAGPPAHDADRWRRGIAELAKRDRVVCKISGIVARAPKGTWNADDLAPIINHCLDVFGPDRVMFASDWPVCTRVATLREWVAALKQVVKERSEDERRKLFADNAVRFYGLSADS